mmetsp:Transcript_32326/g.74458  ORF Transcript_32326/g.74458 Transcript_32326/m.74458 type:complete len:96 (-) Transcript_32326:1529-1816(-)
MRRDAFTSELGTASGTKIKSTFYRKSSENVGRYDVWSTVIIYMSTEVVLVPIDASDPLLPAPSPSDAWELFDDASPAAALAIRTTSTALGSSLTP